MTLEQLISTLTSEGHDKEYVMDMLCFRPVRLRIGRDNRVDSSVFLSCLYSIRHWTGAPMEYYDLDWADGAVSYAVLPCEYLVSMFPQLARLSGHFVEMYGHIGDASSAGAI